MSNERFNYHKHPAGEIYEESGMINDDKNTPRKKSKFADWQEREKVLIRRDALRRPK